MHIIFAGIRIHERLTLIFLVINRNLSLQLKISQEKHIHRQIISKLLVIAPGIITESSLVQRIQSGTGTPGKCFSTFSGLQIPRRNIRLLLRIIRETTIRRILTFGHIITDLIIKLYSMNPVVHLKITTDSPTIRLFHHSILPVIIQTQCKTYRLYSPLHVKRMLVIKLSLQRLGQPIGINTQ